MATKDFIHLSSLNYQKIKLNEIKTQVSASYGSTYNVTFTHSLGYIPSTRVWIEDPGSGIWPVTLAQFTTADLFTSVYKVTSTQVIVTIKDTGGTPRTFKVRARVYYDE